MSWTWDNDDLTFDQLCWTFDGSNTCGTSGGAGGGKPEKKKKYGRSFSYHEYIAPEPVVEKLVEVLEKPKVTKKDISQALDGFGDSFLSEGVLTKQQLKTLAGTELGKQFIQKQILDRAEIGRLEAMRQDDEAIALILILAEL